MNYLNTQLTATAAAAKLCLALLALGMAATAGAAGTTRVIVSYKPGLAANDQLMLGAARGKVVKKITGMDAVALEVSATELARLRKDPGVAYVEEDRKRYPLSLTRASRAPYQQGQMVPYGIQMVQADQLPDTHAANRMVCIIDSGYDRSHEDLRANPAEGRYDAGAGWWYLDQSHHGTHVAGTIAAIDNNGTGVVGVNANGRLRLHIVKVFGEDGWTYSSTLASAANECGAAGANVISMSLGGGGATQTEMDAFDALAARGVLSVAAAGNDGNSALAYPAAYSSVMMVGAVDQHGEWAAFSQYNSKMEIAAPGVGVISTVPMGSGSFAALSVGAGAYAPGVLEGSVKSSAIAPLADFGLGDTGNAAMAGKICLIERGVIGFGAKVANCQSSGGVGAVIYNNTAGPLSGTLGTGYGSAIPAVSASDTEGAALRSQLGQSAALHVVPTNYAYLDGTSMATPHVAAVAALVWSYFPSCTGEQIRRSLDNSALDLGPAGRDDKYGNGLVQAKAAYDRIAATGCGN